MCGLNCCKCMRGCCPDWLRVPARSAQHSPRHAAVLACGYQQNPCVLLCSSRHSLLGGGTGSLQCGHWRLCCRARRRQLLQKLWPAGQMWPCKVSALYIWAIAVSCYEQHRTTGYPSHLHDCCERQGLSAGVMAFSTNSAGGGIRSYAQRLQTEQHIVWC